MVSSNRMKKIDKNGETWGFLSFTTANMMKKGKGMSRIRTHSKNAKICIHNQCLRPLSDGDSYNQGLQMKNISGLVTGFLDLAKISLFELPSAAPWMYTFSNLVMESIWFTYLFTLASKPLVTYMQFTISTTNQISYSLLNPVFKGELSYNQYLGK